MLSLLKSLSLSLSLSLSESQKKKVKKSESLHCYNAPHISDVFWKLGFGIELKISVLGDSMNGAKNENYFLKMWQKTDKKHRYVIF